MNTHWTAVLVFDTGSIPEGYGIPATDPIPEGNLYTRSITGAPPEERTLERIEERRRIPRYRRDNAARAVHRQGAATSVQRKIHEGAFAVPACPGPPAIAHHPVRTVGL